MKFPERILLDGAEKPEIVHQHLARYEFAGRFVRGKRVLDVACGSGYGAAILREAGAAYVLGVDKSESAVEYAKNHNSRDSVEFVFGTSENLSPYGEFDVVVSFETIEHLTYPETFLAQVTRLLSPGGNLIISTPARQHGSLADKPQNPFHVREWSRDEFQALLLQYFRIVDVYGQYNFKRWFPYSRTVLRVLCRSFLPQLFRDIDGFTVRSTPPRHPGFRFEMAFVLALCRAGSGIPTINTNRFPNGITTASP